jgi:hypothetical protein
VFLSSYSFLFDIYQTFCYNTPEARRLPEQGYLTTKEETPGNLEYRRFAPDIRLSGKVFRPT